MKIFAMIPARMGSQRLKHKNLREFDGLPLITRNIRKVKQSGVFTEIWVNSEHEAFRHIAEAEEVSFHPRPVELANNTATSEDYVYEFLKAHPCDYLVQVHSIAPLLSIEEIQNFVHSLLENSWDVLLSGVEERIECMLNGEPVNFSFTHKTNSQELQPVQRISWSITGWRSSNYIEAYESGACATYCGRVEFFPLSRAGGHVIKTEENFRFAETLLHNIQKPEDKNN